jgi:hypothetical protein
VLDALAVRIADEVAVFVGFALFGERRFHRAVAVPASNDSGERIDLLHRGAVASECSLSFMRAVDLQKILRFLPGARAVLFGHCQQFRSFVNLLGLTVAKIWMIHAEILYFSKVFLERT